MNNQVDQHIPAEMQALRVHDFSGPEAWDLAFVATPQPGPDEVLVQVLATGISFVDLLFARGGYQVKPDLPMTPGTEFSGVIAAIGERVNEPWSIGQSVAGTAFGGSWAQYVVATPDVLIALPANSEPVEACDLAITGATAVYALERRAQLQAGETVLVLGAAGGVGLAAVQVAKANGARVIAAASSADKRAFVQSLGADEVIDSSDLQWRDTLRDLASKGVDVVVDPVGDRFTEPAFRSLAWNGRHLVIGFAAGDIPAVRSNLALLKGASLMGVDLRQFPLKEPLAAQANLHRTGELFASGQLRTQCCASHPHTEWAKALERAQDKQNLGKVAMMWSGVGPS